MAKSAIFSTSPDQIRDFKIVDSKRIIHKNLSYEKFKNKRISQENIGMVNRLVNTECLITKNSKVSESYQRHKKYREIRKRYNENGERKDYVPFGNKSLLCPTLAEYNRSGLASQFIEEHLWMSKAPSTSRSYKRKNNFSQGDA
jgi:hypothetical protein